MADKQQEELNLDDLSLDQIRELAEKEAQGEDVTLETTEEQPRDGKGRFAKTEGKAEEGQDTLPLTQQPRVEIDLGDGSGKQVFEGKDWEEVSRKLAKAQENATRKIREMADERKHDLEARNRAAAEKKQVSEDEEFILSQEMMSRPTEAIKKAFKQLTGVDITEFRTVADRAKAMEAAQEQQNDLQKQNDAAVAFVGSHPEYISKDATGQRNGARMMRAMNLLIAETKALGRGVDYPALLEQAYQDLSESGLLELKSDDDVTVELEPTAATQRRIDVVEEAVPVLRRKASNLSPRSRTAAAPKVSGPSEDELYSMPMEKLRELAEKHSRGY